MVKIKRRIYNVTKWLQIKYMFYCVQVISVFQFVEKKPAKPFFKKVERSQELKRFVIFFNKNAIKFPFRLSKNEQSFVLPLFFFQPQTIFFFFGVFDENVL